VALREKWCAWSQRRPHVGPLPEQRPDDLDRDDAVARAAATYYQGSREVKAVLQIPQMVELA